MQKALSLLIDEQMVQYFVRHSCKRFIKGKPIRFGFKLWCICSSDGYMYQFLACTGADAKKEKTEVGLGGNVVLQLL